ncbi:aminotransferase-like mobile domain-containing protein [Tanacetum coccineum]
MWSRKGLDSGSEIKHEAFLALWLSRYVFLSSSDVVVKSLCIVVVCLARGVRIALAPAVLASLVQIWIWKRFPKISPKYEIGCNPRFSRWEKTFVCVDDVGSFVDYCTFEDFIWQSYVKDSNENSGFSEVYQEMGRCVIVGDCLHEELESWVRCIRISEFVRIDGSCIQQYLPHRVAMQFGMNQDVPADVARVNGTHEIAWKFLHDAC